MSRSAFAELRLAVLAAAAAALAAVALTSHPADGHPVADRQHRAAASGSLADSVFLVQAGDGRTQRYGSAFAVESASGEPLLLTNVHVARGETEVSLGADGVEVLVGTPYPGRDAVRLAVPGTGAVALPRAPVPAIGAQVTVAGFPGAHFELRTGTVDAVQRRQWQGCDTEVLIVSAEATGGMSGGVVLDVTGSAVALVAARDPVTGKTVAYPLDELDRHGC